MAVHGSGAGDGEASAVAEGDGPAVADVVWVEIIVLPGVLALTNRSLWDLGFTETIIGSKGSSSSCSFLLFIIYYLLFIIYYLLLFIIYYLLFIIYYLLL